MEELCKKYPALECPRLFIEVLGWKVSDEKSKDTLFKILKANISCIGLEPEEYETVIKWYCDTMEY